MGQSQSTQEEENEQPQQVSTHSLSAQHTNTSPSIVSTLHPIREQHVNETVSSTRFFAVQPIIRIPRIQLATRSKKTIVSTQYPPRETHSEYELSNSQYINSPQAKEKLYATRTRGKRCQPSSTCQGASCADIPTAKRVHHESSKISSCTNIPPAKGVQDSRLKSLFTRTRARQGQPSSTLQGAICIDIPPAKKVCHDSPKWASTRTRGKNTYQDASCTDIPPAETGVCHDSPKRTSTRTRAKKCQPSSTLQDASCIDIPLASPKRVFSRTRGSTLQPVTPKQLAGSSCQYESDSTCIQQYESDSSQQCDGECSKTDDDTRQHHLLASCSSQTKLDFNKIYETLFEARAKWYNLGLALGLDTGTLDSIKHNNKECEDCLREALKKQDNTTKLTWTDIVIALRNTHVGKHQLADTIQSTYALENLSTSSYQPSSDPTPECVVRYASFLKDKYKQMPTFPDDWPPPLKEKFTKLALIERKKQICLPQAKHTQSIEYDYATGNVDNIVERKQTTTLETIFQPLPSDSTPNRYIVVMDGAPGVGKTTLSRKICIDWAEGKLIKDHHIVILKPLRELKGHTAASLSDILKADDPELREQIVKNIQETSGLGVMFIFDGFDELSSEQRSDKNTIFWEIIRGNRLHNCSVLVTSRSYASGPLQDINRVNRHVEVLGFKRNDIEDCIKHNIEDKKKAENLIQMLEERLDIVSLCYIPVNCRIVLYVYQKKQHTLPATLTQLYELFILYTVKRYMNNQDTRYANNIEDFPATIIEYLHSLSKLAYTGMTQDKLVFNYKEVTHKLDTSALSVGLLNLIETFNKEHTEAHYYQFLHLTIQEFLAARYIALTKSNEDKLEFIKSKIGDDKFRMTLLFLSGLTKLDFIAVEQAFPAPKSIEIGVKHKYKTTVRSRFLFLAHLLYESRQTTYNWLLPCLVTNSLNLSGHNLSQFDCLVLANFLALTPKDHVWDEINLSQCSLSIDKIKLLLSKKHSQRDIPVLCLTKHLDATSNAVGVEDLLVTFLTQRGRGDLVGNLRTTLSPRSPFIISIQPNDVCCKPGEEVEFTISTAPSATTYQWYFKNQAISFPDYEGQTSERLLVSKYLPKHKGAYWCVAGDGSGTQITSRHAALTADGEKIEKQELKFIGNILEKSAIDFGKYGIETVLLLNGERDVTYEEMEFVMNLNPRTQVLSINLKQEITSRLKEEQIYAKAIKQKVSLTYTKILALGPGQVGKSTFVRRLLGIMEGNIQTSPSETQSQSSTGISESREACIQYTRVTGAITNKKWCVLQHELHDQLSGLMSLIVKQSHHQQHGTTQSSTSKIETVIQESLDTAVPVKKDETHYKTLSADNEGNESQALEMLPIRSTAVARIPIDTSQIALMPKESDIEKSIKEFEELKHECSHRLDTMEFEMLFNVADVGGQPAFLEMLPSLTIGPALYLVFMNLKQEISSRYSVPFKCKDSRTNICKDYSYTSEEVLFSALSSIACFGHPDEQVEKYVQKPESGDKERKDSLALLVGTFLDEVKNEEEIQLINQQLNERLKGTAFYTQGLVHSKSFSLLVNNMSAEDSEIEDHRKTLETILTEKFRKYQIPTQWLMLSICLKLLARNQNKYHVSFNDCVKLGEYFGMDEEMVSVALQFLHKYIGLILYFPYHKNLKKIVICDPQVVFSTISELIFNIYDHNKNQVSEAHYDRFVETGRFSPQDITLISNKDLPIKEDKKELLSITTLVDLLVYLSIAAKVPVSSGKEEVLYFLPAVLQTAETDVVKRRQKGENDELLPEPICIRFKTGYIPLGFVCALVANLTVEKGFNLLFDESNKLYKNMIQFRFQGIFNVTVISLSRYCEFRVTRQLLDNDVTEFWSENGCPLIMKIVHTVSNKVIQSMQHGLRSISKVDSMISKFAFHCPRHSDADFGQESLAELADDCSDQQIIPEAKCTKCNTAIHPLTPEMMFWFGEKPSTLLKIYEQTSLTRNILSIRADGVQPLTYEWLLGGIKVCDGDNQDYDGYATNELTIKDNDLLSEGVFKCLVKDKFGKCVESDELDLFEDKLRRTWKLKSEINKLKKNGFASIRELKHLQLDTLDFNMGEKERMKPLLDSVRTKYDSSSDEALLSSERLQYPAAPVQISSPVGVSDDRQVRKQKGLQELMKQYSLTDEQLNSEIKNSDFSYLAKYFDGVTIYSNALRLIPAEQADVNVLCLREGTQAAMNMCLSFWNKHNPYAATYRALLELLLELRKERIADKICHHLTQRGVRDVVTD